MLDTSLDYCTVVSTQYFARRFSVIVCAVIGYMTVLVCTGGDESRSWKWRGSMKTAGDGLRAVVVALHHRGCMVAWLSDGQSTSLLAQVIITEYDAIQHSYGPLEKIMNNNLNNLHTL